MSRSLIGRLCIGIAIANSLAIFSLTSHAVDRSWGNNLGGTFTTGANWIGGVVAGPADRAIFSTSSTLAYTVTFPGAVATDELRIDDLVTFDLNQNTYVLNATSTGALTIGSGTSTLTNNRLTVTDGSLSTRGITIAAVADSSASLQVSTGGVVDATTGFGAWVGWAGAGTLNVINGGSFLSRSTTVGFGPAAVGTVIIDGVGSGFGGTGTVLVGHEGAGTFSLRNGATASFDAHFALGLVTGSSGTLLVGVVGGGTLSGVGSLNVGGAGTGYVQLANGLISTSSAVVGNGLGASGTVHVQGGTMTTGQLTIGSAGLGTVLVGSTSTAARLVASTGPNIIGSNSTGEGLLRIFNNGSANLGTGTTTVGLGGVGLLEVLSDGDFASTGTLIFGGDPLSSGSGLVDGASASVSCGTLIVGSAGAGELRIQNGADVASGSGFIAAAAEGTGSVTVSDAGSSWASSGGIFVGGSGVAGGSARLDIGAGAIVSSVGSIAIFSAGQVNLDGGTLSVGSFNGLAGGGVFNFNSGTLIFTGAGGASLTTSSPLGDTFIANAGRTLRVNNTLLIPGGVGAALVMDGGRVQAGSLLNAGNLVLGGVGSRLIAPVRNQGLVTGDGQIEGNVTNVAGFEIRADAGDTVRIVGALSSAGQINVFGGGLDVTGSVTNDPTGRISGRGLFRTGGASNAGTISLSVGPSDFFGALTNTATGKTIVTGNSTSIFYDDVTNVAGSEFRVSTGATAVFFGAVTGLGAFTGSGTTIFEGPASLGPLAAGVSVVEAAGDLTADSIRQAGLVVRGQAAIAPNGSTAATSRLQQLNIEGAANTWTGRLDLSNNDLVVDYTGSSPIAAVQNQIKTAHAAGAWTGNGIATSLGDATHGLGYADNAALGLSSFSGQTVDATSVLVKYTYYGDANLDGQVDITDLAALATAWQASGAWVNGDFDYSGLVDITDLAALATNWQAGVGAPLSMSFEQALASVGLGGVAVPEPTALGLLVAPLVLSRRRSRH